MYFPDFPLFRHPHCTSPWTRRSHRSHLFSHSFHSSNKRGVAYRGWRSSRETTTRERGRDSVSAAVISSWRCRSSCSEDGDLKAKGMPHRTGEGTPRRKKEESRAHQRKPRVAAAAVPGCEPSCSSSPPEHWNMGYMFTVAFRRSRNCAGVRCFG